MNPIPEDLTTEDEAPSAPIASAAPVPPRVWPCWRTDPKTQERALVEVPLRPYKRSIEDLWHRLCEMDVPLPQGAYSENLDAFASAAIKLLFLLTHEPEDYRELRAEPGRFLEVIDTWADDNVPREKTINAVTLALSIHNAEYQAA